MDELKKLALWKKIALGAFGIFVFLIASPKMEEAQKQAREMQSEKDEVKVATKKEKQESEDLSVSAFVMCKNIVEENLLSPSTADFPYLDRKTFEKGNNRYIIKSYVDAQNQYGAMMRLNWHCDIKYKGSGNIYDGNSWNVLALEII